MSLFIDNPITSVQLQLRGGWKNLFITTGVYALIIGGAMILWSQLDPKHLRSIAEGWTIALMVLQVFLVLLFSIVRVNNAVRQDRTSEIIESHRLMPIAGLDACIGYIIGPAIAMVAIGAVNVLAGVISCAIAGLDPLPSLMANGVLFAFLIFACSCSVLIGFYRRALFNLIIVLVIFAFFSRGLVLVTLPGLMVVMTPLARGTIFNPRGTGNLFSAAHLLGLFGQTAVTAIFLAAAARRFRRPDRAAFDILLSLLLLATWIGLNVVGMLKWNAIESAIFDRMFSSYSDRLHVQFVGVTLSALLISLFPIAAAIRDRRGPQQPGSRRNAGLATILTTLTCLVLVSLLVIAIPSVNVNRPAALGAIVISIFATLGGLAALLTIYRGSPRATATMVIAFLLATWFVPVFVDLIYHTAVLDSSAANSTPWSITSFGPVGTLLAPWDPELNFMPGLCCQIIIAVVMITVAITLHRRRWRLHGMASHHATPSMAAEAATPGHTGDAADRNTAGFIDRQA